MLGEGQGSNESVDVAVHMRIKVRLGSLEVRGRQRNRPTRTYLRQPVLQPIIRVTLSLSPTIIQVGVLQ